MPTYSTECKASQANNLSAALDNGSALLYTGAPPASPNAAATGTLLATFALPADLAPVTSTATFTANAIASVTAAATGTPGYLRLKKSDGTAWVDLTAGVQGSGADAIVTGSATSGAPIGITSLTYTQGG